jgi:hypothetical protein
VFYFSKGNNISQRLREVEYNNGSMWIIGDRYGMVKLTPAEHQNNSLVNSLFQ